MSKRSLIIVLWGLLALLLTTSGGLTFQACGLALPGIGTLVAACAAPPVVANPQRERHDALREELSRLERRVALAPACPAPVDACGQISAPLDILILQDLSGSFRSELPTMVRMADDFITRTEGQAEGETRIGFASFIDKPFSPHGNSKDYIYRSHQSLTADLAVLRAKIKSLTAHDGAGGRTNQESQFEAVIEALGRDTDFRAGARRFLVIITDSLPHVAGDWAEAPAPEDGLADGDPINEDYPSPEQVSEALKSSGVVPIFVISSSAAADFYQDFINAHGQGAVISFNNNGASLAAVVYEGIERACQR